MKYKFITIEQRDNEIFHKRPVYRIYNNKSGDQLGIIFYHVPWRKFVFTSQPECLFDEKCLENVIEFLGKLK